MYGKHSIIARRLLLDDLQRLSRDIDAPLLILGDFNTMFTVEDKKGGQPLIVYDTTGFLEFV